MNRSHLALLLIAALGLVAVRHPLLGQQGRAGEPGLRTPETSELAALDGLATLEALQAHSLALFERVEPSLVTVTAFHRKPDAGVVEASAKAQWTLDLEREYAGLERAGSGTGVVVSESGDVLTNRHFLLKPDGSLPDLVDVETYDNRHTIARVVGMEPTLNMAILQLEVYAEGDPPWFEPIVFGDSNELHPGHWGVAVADPFGPEATFAQGIFTATPSRECYQEQRTSTFLQIGMTIHPESHGGPLLNLRGEYVGMLTPRDPVIGAESAEMIAQDRTGLAYALPSNIIRNLYGTIVRNESLESPWLGIAVMSLGELRAELGTEALLALDRPRVGIYVENVFDPSPAFDAGIRPGDWLVKLNGAYIGSPLDFQKQLYMAGCGGTAQAEFWRAGETVPIEVGIEVRPAEASTR